MKAYITMDIKEFLKTTPQNLAHIQFEALKKHSIEILQKVINHIEKNEWDEIDKMLFNSPAGDGYGMDNSCIDFLMDNEPTDISDAITRLSSLQRQSQI